MRDDERAEEGGGLGTCARRPWRRPGGDAGRLDFMSSSKDGHTGGGVVVFVGTEMGEAEKSRRGGRELEVGERCMQFAVVT